MGKRITFFALFLLVFFAVQNGFSATGWIDFVTGEFHPNQPVNLHSSPEINILNSSYSEVILEVNFPGVLSAEVSKEGATYQRLSIPDGGRTYNIGWAELPTLGRFIAVPQGAEPQVEILQYNVRTLTGYTILPAQEQPVDLAGAPEPAFTKDEDFYRKNEFYPDRMAFVEEPKLLRGCPISQVTFFPVQYNPATRELKVYSFMRVRISFPGGNGVFIDPSHRSPYFEPLYQNLLLNYSSLGTPAPFGGKSDTGCDFLIITHPNFQAWAESLATWKNLCGISTWVRTTTQTGSDTGSIRTYIRNAYNTWNPAPSFVLLIGDAEFIPLFYRTTHPYDGYKTGTDLYYATVSGSDWFPDIYMGRISVDSASQAGVVMRKILQYERYPITSPASFYNHVLVAGYFQDDYSPYGWEDRFFIKTSEVVRDFLLTKGYNVERCYDEGSSTTPCCYYYGDPLPSGITWTGNATQISNAINTGAFLVNHRDHGAFEGWGDPPYVVSNVNALNNQDRLPVVMSINCETGHFDNETDASGAGTLATAVCFCEAFQRKSNGGAVGVFGLTRVSYSGNNDEMCKGFYDAMWPDFDPSYPSGGSTHPVTNCLFRMGMVKNFGLFWMYDKYYLTGGSGYPWGADLTTTLITFEMATWFGDPTMEPWTALPQNLSVTHPDIIILGGMPFQVTVYKGGQPVKNALVCLQKGTEIYQAGRTDSSGQITLNPLPVTLGDANLTVTAHDGIPYRTTVPVISPGVYLVHLNSEIDDDSLGASRGNGDGQAGFGETIEMSLPLKNWGDSTAHSVYGILTTAQPEVSIISDSAFWGEIAHYDTVDCQIPFVFAISGQIPDLTNVTFHLEVTATNGSASYDDISMVAHAPILVCDSRTVDDEGGNDNGKPDPGETCDLDVTLRNNGSAGESGISAVLTCSDPYISVINSNASYPNIPSGGTGTSLTSYRFVALSSCPEGHEVEMILLIQGWGPYTTEDTIQVRIGQRPILLVDDDGGAGYESYFLSALDSTGLEYDVWTYTASGCPTDSALEYHQAVIWSTGPDYGSISNPKTLTATDQARLMTYLDNGGKLFLSSQDLLLDNNPNTFIINYLHVSGHSDDVGGDTVNGVAGDTITHGMAFKFTPPFSNFSDWIVPGGGAVGIFLDSIGSKGEGMPRGGVQLDDNADADLKASIHYRALRYPASGSSTYQVIFSAFAFEMVPQNKAYPNNSYTLMRRITDWFGLGRSSPSYVPGDANGDLIINIGDIVYLVNYLYKNGEAPLPIESGDANCDLKVDVGDIVFIVNYLFKSGLTPGC